jgi:hypothetical protein
MVLVALTSTGGVAALLLGIQLRYWFRYDEWNSFPVASILAKRDDTYSVASINESNPDQLALNPIVRWVLDLPTILPLLIALVALLVFWRALSRIEKRRLRP